MSSSRRISNIEVTNESLSRFETSVYINKGDPDNLANILDAHKEECRIFRGGVFGNGYRLDPNRVLRYVLQLYRTHSLLRQYVGDALTSSEFVQLCIDQKALIEPELFKQALMTLKLNPHYLGYILRACDSSDISTLGEMIDLCSKSKYGSRSIAIIRKRIVELTASSESTATIDQSAEGSRKRSHKGDNESVKPLYSPILYEDAQPTTPLYNTAQIAHDQNNDVASFAALAPSPASQANSPITYDAYAAATSSAQHAPQAVYASPTHPAALYTHATQTSPHAQQQHVPSTASPYSHTTLAGSNATSPYTQPINMPSTASPYAQPAHASSALAYTQPVHDVSYASPTHTSINSALPYEQPAHASSTPAYTQPVQVSSSSAAASYTQPAHQTYHAHPTPEVSFPAAPHAATVPHSRQITVSEEELNTYVNRLLNFFVEWSFGLGASQVAQNINLASGQLLAAGDIRALEIITAALHQPLTRPQTINVNPTSLLFPRNNPPGSSSAPPNANHHYFPPQPGQRPQ